LMAAPAATGGVVRTVRERFGRGGGRSSGGRNGYGGAYASRGAFSRRTEPDYSVVSEDESDLLGDDLSEDDV
jgi:hypothetical protein